MVHLLCVNYFGFDKKRLAEKPGNSEVCVGYLMSCEKYERFELDDQFILIAIRVAKDLSTNPSMQWWRHLAAFRRSKDIWGKVDLKGGNAYQIHLLD